MTVVETQSGPVRGTSRTGSLAFLGIPFAMPPTGALRFAAPEAPEPWTEVRDATVFGPTPQRSDSDMTLIPEPAIPGDDTLSVNVFTPDTAGSLPVLVWIHGGGFTSGSAASPWYDGAAFARDGVVTVTVAYRLGFDGFGHIEGAPSNRGVRDWLAALEWVQENIAAFGGDPARVTIAGQSAGGGAVLTLLGMPAAQHLFTGVWALSSALADVPRERARTLSAKLANLAGVPATRDGFASVDEEALTALQERAAAPDGRARLAWVASLLEDGRPWGPEVDGDLVPRPTLESLAAGVGADKPLVLGTTDDEFTMVADGAPRILGLVPPALAIARLGADRAARRAWLADNAAQRRLGTAAVVGRYVTDAVFRRTVVRTARARGDAPTWAYRFSWPSPVRRWALHCIDVPFFWDVLGDVRVDAIAGDAPPQALADAVHGAAAAFVREGAPGWPAWSETPGATRVFGGAASVPDVVADGYASTRALV